MDQLGLWKSGARVAVAEEVTGEAEVRAKAESVVSRVESPRSSEPEPAAALSGAALPASPAEVFAAAPVQTPRAALPSFVDPSAKEDDAPKRVDVPRLLERFMATPTRVTYTNNRSTMISYRERAGVMDVRLHRMFAEASEGIVAALALYLRHGEKRAGVAIDAFIRARQESEPPRPVVCQPVGRFHDLRAMFDELNATYFHGSCTSRITWGTAGARRYRRSIQLGCYVRGDHLIRMHPCLDQAFVPRFYVAWIIFHEMLHEVFGVERRGNRHSIHPPEFVAVEQTFPDYARCKAWEVQNLPRLLRYGSARA